MRKEKKRRRGNKMEGKVGRERVEEWKVAF